MKPLQHFSFCLEQTKQYIYFKKTPQTVRITVAGDLIQHTTAQAHTEGKIPLESASQLCKTRLQGPFCHVTEDCFF